MSNQSKALDYRYYHDLDIFILLRHDRNPSKAVEETEHITVESEIHYIYVVRCCGLQSDYDICKDSGTYNKA